MRFVDCHSVMWPNERYERRMTGQGSRNDAGFEYIYFTLIYFNVPILKIS